MCVFFALLGTPLAIITIADLGKFFSESTIWLFHQYQKAKRNGRKCLRDILKRLRAEWHGKGGENKFGFEPSVGPAVTTAEELALDSEAKVPATLVFAIFLLYIGFGAIMFHMMEGWSSWDSFYFCFITLTTVGFGRLNSLLF